MPLIKQECVYAKLAEGLDYYSGKLMCSEERGEERKRERERERGRELGTLVTSQVSSEDEIAIGWEKLACRMRVACSPLRAHNARRRRFAKVGESRWASDGRDVSVTLMGGEGRGGRIGD